MRLLIALAFIALASAMPEPTPVELPAPSSPTVVTQQTKEQTPVVSETTSTKLETPLSPDTAKPEAIKIQTPVTTVESTPEVVKESSKPTLTTAAKVPQNFQYPGKSELSQLRVQDLPLNDPEAMRKLFPDPMSLIDIRPMLVPQEVMRQVAQRAQMAPQETNAVNVADASPFSLYNAEPLDSAEQVNVVDTPMNQLDSNMNPVLVVESPTDEQAPFAEIPQVPETVKVVDIGDQIPVDMTRPLPPATWRGAPQTQIPHDISKIPPHMLQQYRPVPPSFYRDVPAHLHQRLPKYKDPMLR